ncbi:PDR/VanB family oxidoreductase [Streptomyces plumbiresistens]|uniref:PDR/VanB family oxidoreductase n=1 Tax=Streptomyces plumbiresistens TaxID=511811 RepID=A0ABP7SKF8_9ACTN
MHIQHDETDLRLSVASRHDVAEGVVALELRDAAGEALPAWSAGAHIDLNLAPGMTRQYSLCGDPADRSTWRIGVLLEKQGRGGSRFVHDKLEEGCLIAARGPRNHFVLDPAASYVFIAGGIGITPILPMVAAAADQGAEWELHYGGRTLETMAFRDQLSQGEHAARVHLYPQDTSGLLDLKAILGTPRGDTLVYCCGPEPLLRAVEQQCEEWPAGALRVERFAAVDQGTPVREEAFEVMLAASGITLTVPPGRSILEVVNDAGVEVDSSCAEGICGTCETAVLDGEIDHRDSLLSPDERAANDVMFICVSRAACPRITIDL